MHRSPLAALVAPLLASLIAAAPASASAFCGFYVGGAEARLVNNATQVVLMRDGTRTVLSMQNNYQGPPQDFAMVVPVPVILSEETVKTLPRAVFDRIDQLAAPRLVEYWEQDPCPPRERRRRAFGRKRVYDAMAMPATADGGGGYGVRVEAEFAVGEYQIVILSAEDSTGLDAWLRANNYRIPVGAAEVLRPYVAAGMKFFVAKVDASKVTFAADGQAMLSPLRFHYESEAFALPIRLGLLNAQGKQDLIVHILGRGVRYEVANYDNVAIPTNLEVADATRRGFPGFYAALFDRVLEHHPRAIVTEYAWASSSCDPCPTPPLEEAELQLLGADVIAPSQDPSDGPSSFYYEAVITRLHARYGAETLGEDLVFRAGEAIVGGREGGGPADNERGARFSSYNNFQARYIIRHPWAGEIKCREPIRGVWGGPPGGAPPTQAAQGLAFVARDAALTDYLTRDLADETRMQRDGEAPPAAALLAAGPPQASGPQVIEPAPAGGCGRCDVDRGGGLGLGLLGCVGIALRRRRRRR